MPEARSRQRQLKETEHGSTYHSCHSQLPKHMASSVHQLEEHGVEEGEDHDDRHGSQITSPLLQPSSSRHRRGRSPEEGERQAGDSSSSSSLIEQVALTVPVGDDPATPVLTFRMWVLGTASCATLSFLNAFFGYRKEPLTITTVSAQIAVLPLSRLMAAALPEGTFFRGRPWEFTLNPGHFNTKEHVLIITIFANAGAGAVFGMNLVTSVRVFYGQHMSFFVALLLILSSQKYSGGKESDDSEHLVLTRIKEEQ